MNLPLNRPAEHAFRPAAKTKGIWRWLDRCREASGYRHPIAQLADLVSHKLLLNTSPGDYYRFQFYKGEQSWEAKARFVGLHGSRYWPYENNPRKFNILFTNKLLQKALLQGLGLPTPALVAAIGPQLELNDREKLVARLQTVEGEVVVKPITGTGGRGVAAWKVRRNEADALAEELWAEAEKSANGLLVERRVFNVSPIAEMNPDSLNCFRVITIKTGDGQWHAPAVFLKVGRLGACVDNAAYGGLQVVVDAQGETIAAYDFLARRFIERHPDSGRPLVGVSLPHYANSIGLALEASRKLGFMGTIGWDVAATSEGATLIEGNTLWGVIDQVTLGGFITDEIAQGLSRHGPFSRWDRNYMYPGCDRSKRRWWPFG